MAEIKTIARSVAYSLLHPLTTNAIAHASACVTTQILATPAYAAASSVGLYLAMDVGKGGRVAEVNVDGVAEAAFADGKEVYLPRIVGKSGVPLSMARVESWEEYNHLPEKRWGIPQPSQDAPVASSLDLVVVPGLFYHPESGMRCGRGGGYYDATLTSLGFPPTIGVGFDVSDWSGMVDHVSHRLGHPVDAFPSDDNDVVLDTIILGPTVE